MTIYFYLSLFILLISTFVSIQKKIINIDEKNVYKFLAILLTLISSFRWGVGGDWESYLATYEQETYTYYNFRWSFFFKLLNLVCSTLGTGIYGVNLFVTSIFFIALYRLGKTLKFDLILLLLISFSLIYFNGIMGYVRQTLCLSFVMISIDFLLRKRQNLSALFFVIAVTTHITTLIFAPIYIFLYLKSFFRLMIFLVFSSMIALSAFDLVYISFNEFINKERFSAGSFYRSLPLIFCTIIYFIFRTKFKTQSKDFNLVTDYLFILSIVLISTILFIPAISALADRFSFYLIIFQIYVIGCFFKKIIFNKHAYYLHGAIFVSISYFILTFAWLIFGDYSVYWLDYNFFIQ